MRMWLTPTMGEEDKALCSVAELFDFSVDLLRAAMFYGAPTLMDRGQWKTLENVKARDKSDLLTRLEEVTRHIGQERLAGLVAALSSGCPVPMPVVLQRSDGWYLIGGNARLMACLMLDITPQVWLISLDRP